MRKKKEAHSLHIDRALWEFNVYTQSQKFISSYFFLIQKKLFKRIEHIMHIKILFSITYEKRIVDLDFLKSYILSILSIPCLWSCLLFPSIWSFVCLFVSCILRLCYKLYTTLELFCVPGGLTFYHYQLPLFCCSNISGLCFLYASG